MSYSKPGNRRETESRIILGFFQHQIFHTNQIQIRLLQAFTIYHHFLIPVLRIPESSRPECLESLASDPFYLQVVNFNATNDKSIYFISLLTKRWIQFLNQTLKTPGCKLKGGGQTNENSCPNFL